MTSSTGPYLASVLAAPAYAYAWSAPDGGLSLQGAVNQDHVSFTAGASGSYTLACTVTPAGIGAIPLALTATVQVVAAPTASLTLSNPAPLSGDKILLTPVFTAGPGGTATLGSSGPGSSNIASALTSGQAVLSPRVLGHATFTLTVRNAGGTQVTSQATALSVDWTMSVSPLTATFSGGHSILLTASYNGAPNPNFTWTDGATPGAGASYLWTAPLTPGDYAITATSSLDPAVSTTATMTVVTGASTSLVASTSAPLYGSTTVTVTPSFSGAVAAVVGSTPGGSDISAAASSGSAIPVQAAGSTVAASYWLRTTYPAGDFVDASVTVTPQTVALAAITPASASLTTGATQAFASSVTGALNPSLIWSVDAIAGGNAAVGTISAAGLYTAGTVTGAHTLTATAAADNLTSRTATVTVVAAPVALSLVAAPASPRQGASFTLTPTYSGGLGTLDNGVGCPPSTQASAAISADWSGPRVFTLTVTNPAGATGTATCTVTARIIVVSGLAPAAAIVSAGQTQAFTAAITGSLNGALAWSASGGRFAGNVWTAPAAPGSYTITATSVEDPGKSASTTVTVVVTTTVAISLDHLLAGVLGGASRTFNATITGTGNTGVDWLVLEEQQANPLTVNGCQSRATLSTPWGAYRAAGPWPFWATASSSRGPLAVPSRTWFSVPRS